MDAVVTWVDGADPKHQQKMRDALGADCPVFDPDLYAQRYLASDELALCLNSICKFAPWIARVYIVTDAQDPFERFPELAKLPCKIKVVDHTEIFQGFEDYLPTFNSKAIEALIWRIRGLSEDFLFLNDDMMFIQPVEQDVFVEDGKPRLFFHSRRAPGKRDPQTFPRYYFTMNAQRALKRVLPSANMHLPAHFPTVFRRSVFAEMFDKIPNDMRETISSRHRADMKTGFSANMVHHNWLKERGEAHLEYRSPGVFVGGDEDALQIEALERDMLSGEKLFLCLNDIWKTQERHPLFVGAIRRRLAIDAIQP